MLIPHFSLPVSKYFFLWVKSRLRQKLPGLSSSPSYFQLHLTLAHGLSFSSPLPVQCSSLGWPGAERGWGEFFRKRLRNEVENSWWNDLLIVSLLDISHDIPIVSPFSGLWVWIVISLARKSRRRFVTELLKMKFCRAKSIILNGYVRLPEWSFRTCFFLPVFFLVKLLLGKNLILILVGGLEHFLFFHNVWDNPSHWLIFFKMVETTNQPMFFFPDIK